MGYDLKAKNKDLEEFRFGAFSFPIVLKCLGYLYPVVNDDRGWLMAGTDYLKYLDSRFVGAEYPPILCNDGFKVTAKESKIWARCLKNFVAIAKGEPDENKKIRSDFIEIFEEFIPWLEKSQGFRIY